MTLHVQSTQSAPTLTDLVAYEVEANYTRGERDVSPAADTDYFVGDLLTDDAGTFRLAAAGETVDSVVIGGRFVKSGDTATLLVLERGPARLKESGLRFPAGITAPHKTAILDGLKANNIRIVNAVGQFV